MKLLVRQPHFRQLCVAPARERGLKFVGQRTFNVNCGRSREGAWIEMWGKAAKNIAQSVAPARERGLKLMAVYFEAKNDNCRSREGAWIEIGAARAIIEGDKVAPARERGLKWPDIFHNLRNLIVAPARERGLKYVQIANRGFDYRSLPRGSVD